MSALALIVAKQNKPEITIPTWVPTLGFINCLILVGICIRGLLKDGPTGLYGFIALFVLGTAMYWYTKRDNSQVE